MQIASYLSDFQETALSDPTQPRLSRRGFFIAAASTGAVAAGAVVMPQVKPVATAAAVTPPAPKRGGGYHVSEHVKRYYKTTLV
jgi:hypothetical protein